MFLGKGVPPSLTKASCWYGQHTFLIEVPLLPVPEEEINAQMYRNVQYVDTKVCCDALLCCFSEGRQCNRGFPLPGRTLFAHCVSVGSGAVLYRVSPAKDCLWKLFIAAAANVVFLSVLGVLKQNYCD